MSCVFCRIVAKSQPADILHEDDDLIVFKDINPRAPVHVLLVPKAHLATLNEVDASHLPLLGKLLLTAKQLAAQWGLADKGYRLVMNVGRGGGQVIDHLHLHFLGGWQR
ncbi:MAG: histidine triad nucleotide-binding protein [Candidatus Tectimicrobiota bacterium]|nr:MAG: histidine triad nucleotide-binding protein [Candidatus Tectomicrobia bacterium]